MKVVLKVRKKGVLILPKKLREACGISEDSEVIAESRDGELVIRPLKPKVVDLDPGLVEELLAEEYALEARKYGGILKGHEARS